ncbi:hypothetical protein D6825_04050 [Candidatus Woesearchaeota archaeon]|nr:MAG: hypothetical protein D6825_04050 [Candidatus Woesearchaeota archaeon]
MLFQFIGAPGGQLQQVVQTLEQWGFVDAFLPFLLIFTLVYALLNRLDLFKAGEGRRAPDAYKINGLIAFAISLMVVLPHILGRYPSNTDPIVIINTILPSAAVLLIAVFTLLLLIGVTGSELPSVLSWIIGLVAIGILSFVIIFTIWPTFAPAWILQDPSLQALLIILLVMGLVVWFVTRPDKPAQQTQNRTLAESLTELFGRR